jgi:polyribonucleotide nucleotidyltransferase
MVKVKVINVDDSGRVKLSRKALLERPAGTEDDGGEHRGERRDRGDRGDRRDRGGDRGGRRDGGHRDRDREGAPAQG